MQTSESNTDTTAELRYGFVAATSPIQATEIGWATPFKDSRHFSEQVTRSKLPVSWGNP